MTSAARKRADALREALPFTVDPFRQSVKDDIALLDSLADEIGALVEVEKAARQLVRRDITIEVVALCEASLIAALAALEAHRGS